MRITMMWRRNMAGLGEEVAGFGCLVWDEVMTARNRGLSPDYFCTTIGGNYER